MRIQQNILILMQLIFHAESTEENKKNKKTCCEGIRISSKGETKYFQHNKLGIYKKDKYYEDKATYRHPDGLNFVYFYNKSKSWIVGPESEIGSGGIESQEAHESICPYDSKSWHFYNVRTRSWETDPFLKVLCHEGVPGNGTFLYYY